MRVWRRASGALKDQNSIWLASLSRKTSFRHPEIESSVVKATTHLDSSLDRSDMERVREYVQCSPDIFLRPFIWSLSHRLKKTKNWIVALKGLNLMHHLINTNLPGVNKIGRLPFDLSDFRDGHSPNAKTWSFNVFVRSYFSFLDHKSTLLCEYTEALEEANASERSRDTAFVRQEIVAVHRLQALIDLLIQIRPQGGASFAPLVLDVMEDIIIDVVGVYNRMCGGIVAVLDNILDSATCTKLEAMAALDAVHKASVQAEQLGVYFENCQLIGVHFIAPDLSFVGRVVPKKKIRGLERLVYGSRTDRDMDTDERKLLEEENGVTVLVDERTDGSERDDERSFMTIITDEWEKFDEERFAENNPFATHVRGQCQDSPDLISFWVIGN